MSLLRSSTSLFLSIQPRTDKQKRKDAQNGRKPTYASEGDLSDEQGQPYDPSGECLVQSMLQHDTQMTVLICSFLIFPFC